METLFTKTFWRFLHLDTHLDLIWHAGPRALPRLAESLCDSRASQIGHKFRCDWLKEGGGVSTKVFRIVEVSTLRHVLENYYIF